MEIRPLAGHMDADSADGAVGFYNVRLALNVSVDSEHTRCRLGGWRKFGDASPSGFNNQDFHDQLLDCLWYLQAFEENVLVGGDGIGLNYPYFQPDYLVGADRLDFCGYGPEFYELYPQTQTPGVRFFCNSFIGYPYAQTPSQAGGGIGFSSYATGTDNSIENPSWTLINWDRDDIQDGLDWLDALEAAQGPSQEITDARDFLNNIYGPATDRITDPNPAFVSGNTGNLFWSYQLEETNPAEWYRAFDFHVEGGGVAFYPLCNAGPPDYYATSYFSLCYFDEHAGYFYGDPATVANPFLEQTNFYCGADYYRHAACREAITLLFPTNSVEGARRLIVGTKSKLALLDDIAGNYRILADGLGQFYRADDNCGCADIRFRAAQVGNILLFANGVDPVLWWQHGQTADGCAGWSADYIADLIALGTTSAAVVGAFNGFAFVADLTENGVRLPYRIRWSDFNAPLSFLSPITGSQAGYVDFGFGERIQRIEPVGKQLRVYTTMGDTKRIHLATYVGGDEVWHFDPIYTGPDGLEFENTLVNCGDEHWYAGSTGIFWLGEYDRQPRRIEWLHKGAQVIYKGVRSNWLENCSNFDAFFLRRGSETIGPVNRDRCEQFIGFFDSITKSVWFSWPTAGQECADLSLRFNVKYGGASLVDEGFTAGCVHRPDYSPTLRDWLQQNNICDPGDMLDPKEGLPYDMTPGGTAPSYVRNATEDPDLPVDPDSVCAVAGDTAMAELCRNCDGESLLLLASARDKTIKEYSSEVDYREWYVDEGEVLDCPYTTPGVYTVEGFDSMLQGDGFHFGRREEKFITEVHAEFDAEIQSTPSLLYCQIGIGAQPSCLIWYDTDPVHLACQIHDTTDEEFYAANERQGGAAAYFWHRRGRWIAWRFHWGGIGGGSCFGSLAFKIRLAAGDW